MELTKNELEIADRYISKRETQLAQWPIKRWVILAIFLVAALFGYRAVNDGMRSIQDDRDMDSQVNRAFGEPPPPGLEYRWTVGSMIKISKVLESRYQVVIHSLILVALGYIQVISAAIIIGITILRWNTGERDALICKLLRWKLQELKQNTATDKTTK